MSWSTASNSHRHRVDSHAAAIVRFVWLCLIILRWLQNNPFLGSVSVADLLSVFTIYVATWNLSTLPILGGACFPSPLLSGSCSWSDCPDLRCVLPVFRFLYRKKEGGVSFSSPQSPPALLQWNYTCRSCTKPCACCTVYLASQFCFPLVFLALHSGYLTLLLADPKTEHSRRRESQPLVLYHNMM